MTAKKNVYNLLEQLQNKASKEDVIVDDVLEIFGSRAYAPLFFLIGLLLLSPIAALPGATAVIGTTIALLAIQSFFTAAPWLPQKLREHQFKRGKLLRFLKKALPYIKKLEHLAKPRWSWCTKPPFTQLATLFILILGISTYGLGLIPGGLILPGLAIIFLSIAQFHHDGVWMIFGLTIGSAGLVVGILAI